MKDRFLELKLKCYLFIIVFGILHSYAFAVDNLECIAPAKPGGGHDLTCQLLARSLELTHLSDAPMVIRYMPGGIGALAYNYIAGAKRKSFNTVVAFSTGSALNIAQRKFGKYDEGSVRWLGALVTDYGIIGVSSKSRWRSLKDLLDTLRKRPDLVIFGAGGSIGSQDWMKSALLLKSAGIDPKKIRYVAYEGGGEAINALLSGHIHVFPGDLAESSKYIQAGKLIVLAVFSEKRIKPGYSTIPIATEQGFPVVWPIWRGYYLPPEIPEEDYRWWENTLRRLSTTTLFEEERQRLGFFPFTTIGKDFENFVKTNVQEMRQLAQEFGLVK